jgi:POT family proton-dependent oligopeptide transporter
MIYKELTSSTRQGSFCSFITFFYHGNYFSAFEQAGGLMNLYTDTKTDRMFYWEIPTVMFQSSNVGFIILCYLVASLLTKLKMKKKLLILNGNGIIIMGFGFIYGFAAAI